MMKVHAPPLKYKTVHLTPGFPKPAHFSSLVLNQNGFDHMDSGFACFADRDGHVIRYRPHMQPTNPLSLLSPSWLLLPCSLHHSSASLSNSISHHLHNSLICFSLLASTRSNGKNQKNSSTSVTSTCVPLLISSNEQTIHGGQGH